MAAKCGDQNHGGHGGSNNTAARSPAERWSALNISVPKALHIEIRV